MERQGRVGVVLAMAALVVLVGFIYFYHRKSSVEPAGGTTATSTAPGGTTGNNPVTEETCNTCFSIDDSGKTIALSETSRLSLLLPSDIYDNAMLSVSPKGALGETFGASAPVGAWIRTFEATTPGTASILVPAKSRNDPPYTLTIITVDKAHAWENGFVVVRKTDANQTISLVKHERFIIEFGSDLTWAFAFDPKGSITRVPGSVSTGGIQGVYEANTTGTSTLSAIGAPICTTGACPQFRVSINVNFIIR